MIIHNDWKKKSYLMPVALGLLLVVARMPDLMAEGIPTNEMPTKLSALIEEARKIPLSYSDRKVFLKTRLRAMGSEGVELLIGELKKPTRKPIDHGLGYISTFPSTACEIYADLGQDACDRLSEELKKDSSPLFWRNACYVYQCSDHDDSLDVLAGWVIENGADTTSKLRISAEAYSRLHSKLLQINLPAPPFSRQDNDLPAKFQPWWQSNRQTVVQQYLDQKKPRSEPVKVPDK